MKVRRATKDDEQLIRQVHKENNDKIGTFNLFYIWDKYLDGSSKYVYYVIEGKGFMRYGYSKMLKCYSVKEIGILNEFKGSGIGKEFFKIIKSPTYLTCNIDNESGNRFYEKMGMKFKGVKLSRNKKQKMNIWVI